MNSLYFIVFDKKRLEKGQQVILVSYNIPLPGANKAMALQTLGQLASTLKWNCQGDQNPPEIYASPNGLQSMFLAEDPNA